MKHVYLMKISVVLLAMLCWSFTDGNINEADKVLTSENVVDASSCVSVGDGQSVSIPGGDVVPRMGQSYFGSIGYRGYSYPIYIFWDSDASSFNASAFLGGDIEYPTPSILRYVLQHISTRDSESTLSKFWFIIKCDYIIEYEYGSPEYSHVKFLVTFNPSTQYLTCEVLEEGPGSWNRIDLEID